MVDVCNRDLKLHVSGVITLQGLLQNMTDHTALFERIGDWPTNLFTDLAKLANRSHTTALIFKVSEPAVGCLNWLLCRNVDEPPQRLLKSGIVPILLKNAEEGANLELLPVLLAILKYPTACEECVKLNGVKILHEIPSIALTNGYSTDNNCKAIGSECLGYLLEHVERSFGCLEQSSWVALVLMLLEAPTFQKAGTFIIYNLCGRHNFPILPDTGLRLLIDTLKDSYTELNTRCQIIYYLNYYIGSSEYLQRECQDRNVVMDTAVARSQLAPTATFWIEKCDALLNYLEI